jgi:metallo-beta-lactamase family protein
MLEWLKAVDTSKLKRIFLVHGEKKSQAFLKKYLEENGFPNVEIVRYGKTYDLK